MLRTAKIANDFRREGTTAQPLGVLDFLYRARLVVVHGFVRRLLSCLQGRKVQLLLLGAGLDESFQTKEYRDAGVGIVFAVDLPEVIAQRERGSPELVNVSFDLNAGGGALLQALEAARFNSSIPTIVVLEMVMGYVGECAVSSGLLPYLASLPTCVVSYDATINRQTSFGSSLFCEFARHGTPLQCTRSSPRTLAQLFIASGFGTAVCHTISNALQLLGLGATSSSLQVDVDTAKRVTFDEHAALGVLLSRYTVSLCGSWMLGTAPLLPFAPALHASASASGQQNLCPPQRTKSCLCFCSCDLSCAFSLCIRATRLTDMGELSAVAELYLSSHQPWSRRFPQVAKFVNATHKTFLPLKKNRRRWGGTDAVLLVAIHPDCDGVVGCVALALKPSRADVPSNRQMLELSHVCVLERFRKIGVGARLIQAALDRTVSPSTIHLSVLQDQKEGLRLYRRFGFEQEGETDCGGGCVIVHMAKNI